MDGINSFICLPVYLFIHSSTEHVLIDNFLYSKHNARYQGNSNGQNSHFSTLMEFYTMNEADYMDIHQVIRQILIENYDKPMRGN